MMICATCGLTREGGPRLPKGWKRHKEVVHCKDCWRKAYVLRAAIIPVAEPLSGSWEDFRAALRTMWIETTRASNWIMTELYKRDVRRNGDAKMPKMTRSYL